jgi:hypothetical protein
MMSADVTIFSRLLYLRTGNPGPVCSIAREEDAKDRFSDAFAAAYLASTSSGSGFGSDFSILRQRAIFGMCR